ncbi:DUF6473 family protein [Defluviimonas salinarum]|uniref:DUF6473 family protein n=1 Tax=Defluviimonas salinarum TaxID=2992147 RepID=A0ABT3IYQ9_9RHOB|nr:DUF6473 family protein [Defluviimonas salinarum]MCW3780552.1 DUF6473 family protein [Defluviimonas salinarum]
MTCEFVRVTALDYFPCRYGQSKVMFRGQRRRLDGRYVAVLGGTETYGKFIEEPYPALMEKALDLPVVNFGCMNAGPDAFLAEPVILSACARARVTVIQLMGAQNITNRFYAVHPRRNDRFLRASAQMKSIFPDIDFTEFNFTGHMLGTLKEAAPDRFRLVAEELKAAWTARMRHLLQKIDTPTVILWLQAGNSADPLVLNDAMIAAIRPFATDFLRVTPSAAARMSGTEGMHFAPLEEPAAATMPGPLVHREVADVLGPVLRRLL